MGIWLRGERSLALDCRVDEATIGNMQRIGEGLAATFRHTPFPPLRGRYSRECFSVSFLGNDILYPFQGFWPRIIKRIH